MKKKIWGILLGLEAVICLITAVRGAAGEASAAEYVQALVTFPYVLAAGGLRELSLSGAWGNALAVILYVIIGLIPLVYGAWRLRRGRGRAEDGLLVLLSLLLLWGCYLLINPALIDRMMGRAGMTEIGRWAVCSAVDAVIVCYAALRLLRFASESRTKRLLGLLQLIMGITLAVLVFRICASSMAGVLEELRTVAAGNQPAGEGMLLTGVFLFFRYLLGCAAPAMDMVLVISGCRLAEVMKQDRYGKATVLEAKRLAKVSRLTVVIISATYMIQNLVQLLFSSRLLNVSFAVSMPLGSIAMALAAMAFARYLAETHLLKEENDMII